MRFNPCIRYLIGRYLDCENYVAYVLELKGYVILERDAHGYDILAYDGHYKYYIEVKEGRGARLSTTQRRYREYVRARRRFGSREMYVICHFDDDGSLIGDEKYVNGY